MDSVKKRRVTLLGTLNELVREGGSNNKDGWRFDRTPSDEYRPSRLVNKPSFLSRLLFHS